MKRGLFLTAVPLLAATLAGAQEMATIATRPGVTQSFFIEGMHGRKPEALALLYVGGGGNIRLRMEDGRVKFAERNFLPRSRGEFIRNGILPVVMDAPSDQGQLTDGYRMGEAQAADARAVIAELKKADVKKVWADEEIHAVIQKAVKQRKDSIASFTTGGRADLAAGEEAQIRVLQKFLPAQMGEDEIKKLVDEAVAATGASGAKDMGKVMGWLMPKVKGKADGGLVNQVVKSKLG